MKTEKQKTEEILAVSSIVGKVIQKQNKCYYHEANKIHKHISAWILIRMRGILTTDIDKSLKTRITDQWLRETRELVKVEPYKSIFIEAEKIALRTFPKG